MSAIVATDDNFESEVLKSSIPVLVDFWAEWCGPCKALLPVIEEIASEMKDKIKVVKVSVDECVDVSTKYGIRAVPTLMLFKDGQPVKTQTGATSKTAIVEWISDVV